MAFLLSHPQVALYLFQICQSTVVSGAETVAVSGVLSTLIRDRKLKHLLAQSDNDFRMVEVLQQLHANVNREYVNFRQQIEGVTTVCLWMIVRNSCQNFLFLDVSVSSSFCAHLLGVLCCVVVKAAIERQTVDRQRLQSKMRKLRQERRQKQEEEEANARSPRRRREPNTEANWSFY